MIVAGLMLVFGRRRERLLALTFIGGVLVTELLVMPWLRELWPRPRPFTYLPGIRTLGPRWDFPSFPSAHAHLWTQAALLFGVAYPRLRWPLLAMLVLTLYSRPYVGNHHVLDTLAGAAVGGVTGGVELAIAGRLGLVVHTPAASASDDPSTDISEEQECQAPCPPATP